MKSRHSGLRGTLRSLGPLAVLLGTAFLFVAARLEIHPSPEAVGGNGSAIGIGYLEDAYIYCWEEGDEGRLVLWQTSDNQTVGSFVRGRRVFATGCYSHIPHCILIFMEFTSDLTGEYRCMSLRPGTPSVFSRIIIQEATPSRSVLDVGRCRLRAGAGEAAACLDSNSSRYVCI